MYRGLLPPQNARVLYLDMNAFFASVEQQRRPELRGLPVAVVSHIGRTGTVLASSYEAKAFGIKTGMRLADAQPLCPQMKLVETSFAPYKAVHNGFMHIVRDLCGPEAYARSIDEAAIPLSPNWYGSERAWSLAEQIKERIRRELGEYIRCSIGIAPNTFLAKTGTQLHKPDGLTEITLENTPAILAKMELTQLTGIAERYERRLVAKQIHTPLDLYDASPETLRRQFGIWGQYWWWRLHGYEADVQGGKLKSMSHEHALKHWAKTSAELRPVIDKLSDRLIHRLRRNHLQCLEVGLFVRSKGYGGLYLHATLPAGSQTYGRIHAAIERLISELPAVPPGPYKKVGIVFHRLVPEMNGAQLGLFPEPRDERISAALEAVRSKHGLEAITRGTVMGVPRTVAREVLGFGRVKDI
jgi:DNA polymerase-4